MDVVEVEVVGVDVVAGIGLVVVLVGNDVVDGSVGDPSRSGRVHAANTPSADADSIECRNARRRISCESRPTCPATFASCTTRSPWHEPPIDTWREREKAPDHVW